MKLKTSLLEWNLDFPGKTVGWSAVCRDLRERGPALTQAELENRAHHGHQAQLG